MTASVPRRGALCVPIIIFALSACDGSGGVERRPPFLAASATTIDFGERTVGLEEERTVYLINKGQMALHLEVPEGDTQNGIFAVLLDEYTVESEQNAVAHVRFRPADPMSYQALITIENDSANEPAFRLTIVGSGVEPDPCENVDCSSAPPPSCIGENTTRFYQPLGVCEDGRCVHEYHDDTCERGCDSETGRCRTDPCAGLACNTPPSACFFGQGVCVNGACEYEVNNAGTCNDGNACTENDRCEEGNCVGDPTVCDTPPDAVCLDASTREFYNPQGICDPMTGACEYQSQLQVCNFGCTANGCEGDPCQGITCETPPSSECFDQTGMCTNGVCQYGTVVGSCDDGDGCTVNDTCSNGACRGVPKTCNTPPATDCADGETLRLYDSVGTCTGGACQYTANSVSCNDGNACTNNDYCSAGTCHSGPPLNCDDGNACTSDYCDPQVGCRHDPISGPSCVTGSGACPVGSCVSGSCLAVPNVTCVATIDVDLCQDVEVAGVCSASGECVVTQAPPGFTCPGCAGVCVQCYFIQFCWEF